MALQEIYKVKLTQFLDKSWDKSLRSLILLGLSKKLVYKKRFLIFTSLIAYLFGLLYFGNTITKSAKKMLA